MARVYNFAAGPAMLPLPVLERAQGELLEWGGTGMSAMELNHRGPHFKEIARASEAKLRALLQVPQDYRIVFMHGPARVHFAAVPMNLANGNRRADYLDTGLWSEMAIKEARRFCDVNVVASSAGQSYTCIPSRDTWKLSDDPAFVHYTPNETIGGVEFHDIPDVGDRALVADMSSNILSGPLDVSRFGLIYAGAQKNVGIPGLTIVIVHDDLLERDSDAAPLMLDYSVHAKGESLACTAPTFAWYVAGLIFDWLEEQGGLEAMADVNRRKSEKLYRFIQGSNFYSNPVREDCRSRMNVPFRLAEPDLDERFLDEAREAGLEGLKGHRYVGGMRASLYNAMPEAGVDALVDFMQDFVRRHG